jgi:hypothetical protein
MAQLLDDEGRFFGVINVVDLLVLLCIGALGVASLTVLTGFGSTDVEQQSDPKPAPPPTTVTATIQATGLQPYVADAVPEDTVPADDVGRIRDKAVTPTEVIKTRDDGSLTVQTHPRLETVTLQVTLQATIENGEFVFRDDPVEVGRSLSLDTGPTTIKGTITAFEADDEKRSQSQDETP